jgi:OmpA-OmpF porin, OOP family
LRPIRRVLPLTRKGDALKQILLTVFFTILGASAAFAEEDVSGSKDHPLLTRLPGAYIEDYSAGLFQAKEITLAEGKTQNVEGYQTSLGYRFPQGQGQHPSWLQIVKNYENALVKIGGKKRYSDGQYASYLVKQGDKDIWVVAELGDAESSGAVNNFVLYVLEAGAMQQEITASDMLNALNKDGYIALYINFETGKADIKSDSRKIVDQIAEMLKSNPSLKVSIEGHTDNVGSQANNKILSENRAKAVMGALVAAGIAKARLTAKGWGQEKPLADNRSEDGKAKNRRVEIVKL